MPDYTQQADLQAAVTRALGQRSGSEALKAVAYWKETGTFWAVKQGGFLSDEEMGALRQELGTEEVYQAWLSKCDIDWTAKTGLRARMMAVSAHLNQMVGSSDGACSPEAANARDLVIAANCDCRVECELVREQVPADSPADDADVHSTWWTFMSDIPFEQYDRQFKNAGSLIGVAERRATYPA